MMFLSVATVSNAMLGAVSQGVLWSIMALGVYITFKILNFPDMTVDGSFATGGCTCAMLLVHGCNPALAMLIALVAGAIAGLFTGLLATKLKIPGILSGILMMLALYSINLRIMGGPNKPLARVNMTTMNFINKWLHISDVFKDNATSISSLITGVAFVAVVVVALYWFFGTEVGCAVRSTGDNPNMSRALGVNTDNMQILALMVSNALVALSGALVAQQQRFGDVSMGIGTIVIGLASIIIGEVVFGKKSFWYCLLTVVFGSVIYRLIIAVVLQLGMKTQDLKLLSATVVTIALSIPVMKKKFAKRQNSVQDEEIEEEKTNA